MFTVDPFVKSHKVIENDNGAIDDVVTEWAHIADECNCSIELVHHVRKPPPGARTKRRWMTGAAPGLWWPVHDPSASLT